MKESRGFMYFAEGHNLIARVLGSVSQVLPTLYLFLCTIILCELAWLFFFSKRSKPKKKHETLKHMFWLHIFLFYLMLVYLQTGIVSAFWWLNTPLINFNRIYLIPFTTSPDLMPYLFNVLMTVPLGFLLPIIWPKSRSLKKTALAGFILSFSIETIQLFSNRVTSTSDLIMNTLGAVIGYFLFVIFLSGLYRNVSVAKKEKKVPNGGFSSWLINQEAFVYLFLSLIGVTFIHHPGISIRLPQSDVHHVIEVSNEVISFETMLK